MKVHERRDHRPTLSADWHRHPAAHTKLADCGERPLLARKQPVAKAVDLARVPCTAVPSISASTPRPSARECPPPAPGGPRVRAQGRAAVPTNVCTSPDCASTPICAFIPKCHAWTPPVCQALSSRRLEGNDYSHASGLQVQAVPAVPDGINRGNLMPQRHQSRKKRQ